MQYVSWNSTLLFPGAVATLTILAAIGLVPESRDPETARPDMVGLTLSTAGLGVLVYSFITAPDHGWASAATLGGLGAALVVLLAFVLWERRHPHPMLDVGILKNLRFTAASFSVAVAFFAMFGFIFLITQYFQFIKAYEPFEAGLRLLPFAAAVGIASIAGARLAVAIGTKLVVATGLVSLAVAFVWASDVDATTSYLVIASQMVLLGGGLGLTSAPATEAIMGVIPAAKAGIGSAVNDATREIGGTLGVAIIGSVSLSLYRDGFTDDAIPAAAIEPAKESIGSALSAAAQIAGSGNDATAQALAGAARSGFLDGLQAGCLVAAVVIVLGALLVLAFLPAHPTADNLTPDGPPAKSPILRPSGTSA